MGRVLHFVFTIVEMGLPIEVVEVGASSWWTG